MTVFFLQILIVVAVVGTVHTSKQFRDMSRELDEAALASFKRIMHAAEESGYPPEMVTLLLLLLSFALMYATTAIRVYGP